MAKKYIVVDDGSENEGCLKQIGEFVGGCIFLVIISFIVKAGCH